MASATILFKDESYKIIGACMKVHRELGSGFLKAVYEEALKKEFVDLGIPFENQVKLNIYYNGEQIKNYLTATKKELGMLINFEQPSLVYKRILNTNNS